MPLTSPLPLFPLSTLVMPEGLLPLRLFEPRYLDMVKNCFKTETGFGVCLIEAGSEVGAQVKPYPRGTHVRIIDFDQGSDGLLHITAQGIEEFLLDSYQVEDNGLLVGQVRLMPIVPATALPAQYDGLASKLEAILKYVETHIQYADVRTEESEWVCNRLLELLPLEASLKFEMLSMSSVEERLEALDGINFTIDAEQ